MADVSVPSLNYTGAFSDVPNPTQSFIQGVQGGLDMQNAQLLQAQKTYAFQRTQQMQQAAGQVAQNPTPENIARLSIAFPEMSQNFKQSYDMLQPAQQRADLNFYTQVHAAAMNDEPEIAAQLLNGRADSLENSGGDPQKIASTRAWARWATLHPDTFKMASGALVAGIVGPERYGQTFKDVGEGDLAQKTMPAKVQEATATASKATTDADLERARLTAEINAKNAETGKTVTMMGLPPPDAQKRINDGQAGAAANEATAARLDNLANQVEQASYAPGVMGKGIEALKRITGTQDSTSALKAMVSQALNQTSIENLKSAVGGGKFTDTDMRVAMGPAPDANSDPQVLAQWMRGMAKLQRLDAVRQQAEGEWLSQVGAAGHTGPAPHDLSVMGTQVPRGTTFADFSRQFLQKKSDEIAAQSSVAAAQGKGYMRFATPNAGTPTPAPAPGMMPTSAPAPVAAPAAPPPAPAAAPTQPASEMDVISGQLAQLTQQRDTLQQQVKDTQGDILRATSQSGKRFFTPDVVAQMQSRHTALASQLGAVKAQIDQLNARGRTASTMAPGAVPPALQKIMDKYRLGQP